jgi:hypothetical protein
MKDQEEFNKEWESVSVILNENESVPTGFTDYCRELVLYAHSIDDIKDDDIDKIKKKIILTFYCQQQIGTTIYFTCTIRQN